MNVFRTITLNALIVGFLIGLIITLVQSQTIYPLILEAEVFEERATQDAPHEHTEELELEKEVWTPENGSERTLYSAITNIFLSIAFCILINIGFVLYPPKVWYQGIFWGLAGVTAFYIIPTLVYDPVLPGTIEADHLSRQLWWLATVECSIFGLAIMFFFKHLFLKLVGFILVSIAIIIGAPPGEFHAISPSELVDIFILYNMIINVGHWIILGAFSAFLFMKNMPDSLRDQKNV